MLNINVYASVHSGASTSLTTCVVGHHVREVRSDPPPRSALVSAPLSTLFLFYSLLRSACLRTTLRSRLIILLFGERRMEHLSLPPFPRSSFFVFFVAKRLSSHHSPRSARHCTPLVAETVVAVSTATYRHTALPLRDTSLVRDLTSVHRRVRIRLTHNFASLLARYSQMALRGPSVRRPFPLSLRGIVRLWSPRQLSLSLLRHFGILPCCSETFVSFAGESVHRRVRIRLALSFASLLARRLFPLLF